MQRGEDLLLEDGYLRVDLDNVDGSGCTVLCKAHVAVLLRDRIGKPLFLNGDVAPGGHQVPVRVLHLCDRVGNGGQRLRAVLLSWPICASCSSS